MGPRRSGAYKPGTRTRANGYKGQSGWVSRKRPAGQQSASSVGHGMEFGDGVEHGGGHEVGGGGVPPLESCSSLF